MFSSRALCIAAAVGLVTTLVTAEPHLTFEDTDAADGGLLGGTVSIICQSSEYLDNGKCEDCPTECDTCVDANKCTGCKSSSQYVDNGKCEDCPTECDTCIDANKCTRCKGSNIMLSGKCVESCPDGFVAIGAHCKEARFGFVIGDMVQSVQDASIVGFVVAFTNSGVKVAVGPWPLAAGRTPDVRNVNHEDLHAVNVADRVSSLKHDRLGKISRIFTNLYVEVKWDGDKTTATTEHMADLKLFSPSSTPSPLPQTWYWAVDGAPADRGGGHEENTCVEATMYAAATRCCGDSNDGTSCKSICTGSPNSKKAAMEQYTTRAASAAHCAADEGRRLCTVEELARNVCLNKGCWFNQVLVWTSDSCQGAFTEGEKVMRRNRGDEWGLGFVTSVRPLLQVTASSTDPDATGFSWNEIRKETKPDGGRRLSGADGGLTVVV